MKFYIVFSYKMIMFLMIVTLILSPTAVLSEQSGFACFSSWRVTVNEYDVVISKPVSVILLLLLPGYLKYITNIWNDEWYKSRAFVSVKVIESICHDLIRFKMPRWHLNETEMEVHSFGQLSWAVGQYVITMKNCCH